MRQIKRLEIEKWAIDEVVPVARRSDPRYFTAERAYAYSGLTVYGSILINFINLA